MAAPLPPDDVPDVQRVAGEIRAAVERYSRDELVELLTYVFKRYVVEAPAPIEPPASAADEELDGSSFASLVRSLQLRYDLPELSLFEVQGERVVLRAAGRAIAIEPPAPAPGAPQPSPSLAMSAPPASPMAQSPTNAPRENPIVPPSNAIAPTTNASAPSPSSARSVPAPAPSSAPAKPAESPPGSRTGLLEID